MSTNRSISQRLKKAAALETKLEIANEWADSWEREQTAVCRQLGKAIADDDYDALCRAAGQLKAISEKKFAALKKVFEALSQRD